MRNTVRAFKALSDETRLRILNVLLVRECCVCEVMQALEISETRASRNLATLHDAGFLSLRRQGQWSVYSLDKEGMQDYLKDLLKAATTALEENSIIKSDRERLKKAQRVGLGCTGELTPQKANT